MTDALPAIVMRYLLTTGLQAAALAVVIWITLLVFRGRVAPHWRHRLWWLVVLRLAVPILPASPLSLYQWLPGLSAAQPAGAAATSPSEDIAKRAVQPEPSQPRSVETDTQDTPAEPNMALSESLASPTQEVERGAPELASRSAAEITALPQIEPPTPETGLTTPDAVNTPTPWASAWIVALLVWLAGAALLIARTLMGWSALLRRVRRDTRPATTRTTRLLEEQARILGVRPVPTPIETTAVAGPTLLGVFRPTLLLPPGLADALDNAALGLIFRHELYHQRGRDNLANWLLTLLRALHWFNPLAWWAIAQLRTQRELARDSQTLDNESPDHGPAQYADALLAVVRFAVEQPPGASHPSPVTSAAVRDRKHLARRLAMICTARRYRFADTVFACALLIVLAVTGLTAVQAQGPADTDSANLDAGTDSTPNATTQDTPTPREETPEPVIDEATRLSRQVVRLADWENIPFEEAIAQLETQIGMPITFDPMFADAINAMDVLPTISLRWSRAPLGHVLTRLLEGVFRDDFRDMIPPVKQVYSIQDGALHFGFAASEIRVYDIRDLICPAPADVTQAPRTEEETQAVRQEYLQQVRGLILETVGKPAHWFEEYADTDFGGTIRELNGNLIITTTPENHRTILALLGALRESRGLMITYESQLFLLDTDTFVEIFSEDIHIPRWGSDDFHAVHEERLHGQRFIEHDDGSREPLATRTPSGFIGTTWITDEQRDALAQRVDDSQRPDHAVNLPRITDFNGRQSWVMIAQQVSYISSIERIVDTDKLEPTLSVTQYGTLLLLEGTLSADREYVTLRIELEAAAMIGTPIILPLEGDTANGFTEVPQIDRVRMNTTVAMPKNEWLILVGPMITGDIGVDDDPADYTDTRRVVLLIKPTIIELAQQEIDVEDAAVDIGRVAE
ncbi:MAG: M56 family metallopeptidase [Planctomycetota bacterium]